MIYDEIGNLNNKAAFKAGKEIGQIVEKLVKRLFKQGMTIVECRALITFLQGQVSVSTIIELLQEQYDAMRPISRTAASRRNLSS